MWAYLFFCVLAPRPLPPKKHPFEKTKIIAKKHVCMWRKIAPLFCDLVDQIFAFW